MLWLFKPDTLIRAVLHINPDELEEDEWVHQAKMAEWALAVLREGKLG